MRAICLRVDRRHLRRLVAFVALGTAVACAKSTAPPDASTIDVVPTPSASATPPVVADVADAAPEPWDGSRCDVTLGALLDANVYRGVRNTPSRQATLDNLDPRTRERWHGRDHAVSYILCKYAVKMNGSDFTFEHQAGQSIGDFGALDKEKCGTKEERAKVLDDIKKSTKNCADPHAGAYWGSDLVPAKR